MLHILFSYKKNLKHQHIICVHILYKYTPTLRFKLNYLHCILFIYFYQSIRLFQMFSIHISVDRSVCFTRIECYVVIPRFFFYEFRVEIQKSYFVHLMILTRRSNIRFLMDRNLRIVGLVLEMNFTENYILKHNILQQEAHRP